jgi:hypothetical protein
MSISSAEPLLFYPRRGCWPDMDTRQAAIHLGLSRNYLNSFTQPERGPRVLHDRQERSVFPPRARHVGSG